MIQDVGAFRDQGPTIATYRFDQALDRFLAKFLRDFGGPARQQPR